MDDTVKHGITSGPYRNVQHWTTRLKKGYHFYFCKNFGKCRPILIIFALSVSFQEKIYAGFCPTMSHGSRKRGLWPNRGLTSLRLRRMTSSPSQTLRRPLTRTVDNTVDLYAAKKRSKVKEIIVLIKARSFLDELNLEHLTSWTV